MIQHQTLPPHSVEIEDALLGSLIIDPDAFMDIDGIVQAEDFYMSGNRSIFEAIQRLYEAGSHIDIVTIGEELTKHGVFGVVGGDNKLFDLLNAVPTSMNATTYAKQVSDKAIRRRMINTASTMARYAYDESDDVEKQLALAEMDVMMLRGERVNDRLYKPKQYTSEFIDRLQMIMSQDEPLLGLPTGFTELDKNLLGFGDGNLYIVAGRSSMGKSSLLLDFARIATLKHGKRALYWSGEMDAHTVTSRMVASETGIPLENILTGKLSENQLQLVLETTGRISESFLIIDTSSGITPSKLSAKARRLYAEYGLDAIYVDYLGLMAPDKAHNTKNQEVGSVAWALKTLAGDLRVPIIAAHQVNRDPEKRHSKKPMLSDLRDSGNIEEHAFAVMLLYRDEYYNPDTTETPSQCEVIIAKNRNGKTGSINLYWNGKITSFRNLETKSVSF